MKILRICPGLVRGRLEKISKLYNLKEKSFDEIIDVYKKENILLPGSWSSEMQKRGFQTLEVLYPDLCSQLKWIHENNFKSEYINNQEADQFFQILKYQVKTFKPNIIFIYAGACLYFPPSRIKILKELRKIQDCKFICYWGDELKEKNHTYSSFFKFYDLFFTSNSIYTQIFQNNNYKNAYTLGNCFEPNIEVKNINQKKYNLSFSGVSGYGYDDHIKRYENLIQIIKKSDIKIWAYEPRNNFYIKKLIVQILENFPVKMTSILFGLVTKLFSINDKKLKTAKRLIHSNRISGLDFYSPNYFEKNRSLKKIFPSRVKKSFTSTKDYYNLILRSNFCLNLHRDEIADVGNIRSFEVTGLGSCLISDRGKYMNEFFDTDSEIIGFNTLDDFFDKYKFALNNPKIASQIAENGKKRTLRDHTTSNRCDRFVEILSKVTKDSKVSKIQNIGASRKFLNFKYDLTANPISFDFFFFLEAASIIKEIENYEMIQIFIKIPEGYFKNEYILLESDTFSKHNTDTNTQKINNQILSAFKYFKNIHRVDYVKEFDDNIDYYFGPEHVHHAKYYQILNFNPDKKINLQSNVLDKEIIKNYIQTLNTNNKKVVTVSIRNYHDATQRNSNLNEWKKAIQTLKKDFFVVLVPDSSELSNNFQGVKSYEYLNFNHIAIEAAINFDIRLALYECVDLNLFVNNGPCVVASLSNDVKFLMFKILVDGIPHTEAPFLRDLGYVINENPKYLNKKQKYIWKDDTAENIISEVYDFI